MLDKVSALACAFTRVSGRKRWHIIHACFCDRQMHKHLWLHTIEIFVAHIKECVNSWLFYYMVTQRQGPSILWLHHLYASDLHALSPQMGQEKVENTTHTYFLKFSGGITFLLRCKREIYVVLELAATIQWQLYTMEVDIGLFLPWVVSQ